MTRAETVRRGWPIVVALSTVMVAVAVVGFSWWTAASAAPAALAGYRVDEAGTTVVVVVETGPDDQVTTASVSSQTSDAVEVDIRVHRASGMRPLVAVRRDVSLRLAAPLGDRVVRQVGTGRMLERSVDG
jgi:hypothetical protein